VAGAECRGHTVQRFRRREVLAELRTLRARTPISTTRPIAPPDLLLHPRSSPGTPADAITYPYIQTKSPPAMGRYDFRPMRVRQTAKALFDSKREPNLPQWYDVVGNIPPGETLARPVLRIPKMRKARKASKLFQPLPIAYPEDKLRSEFFGDHPWELARPRLVVEDSGNDSKKYDWSKIVQPGKQLDGERYPTRLNYTIPHHTYTNTPPASSNAKCG